MKKRSFYSQLFRRNIEPYERDYWQMYYSEALYRLKDLEERDCSCMKCRGDREKLEAFVKKQKDLLWRK